MTLSILAFIVAAYGAILSTINLYTQRRDKQSRVKVSLSTGIVGLAPGVASDACLFLEASNPGHKAVVVNIPGLELPDGRFMSFPYSPSNVTFPFKLQPEDSCRIAVDLKKAANQLRAEGFNGKITVVGYINDAVGRRHKSKPYKIDLDIWGST
jgi:hypothetical protein